MMNLLDYVKTYNNSIDKDKLDTTVRELKSVDSEFEQHTFYDAYKKQNVSFEKELSVAYSYTSTKAFIMHLIWNSLKNYIKDINSEVFTSWQGYSEVRFNRYNPNTQMAIHCDHIHTLFDGNQRGIPILTILGLLNDDFEGGDFILCGEKVEFKAGDIMIFPSNFLYPHKVDEITKGIRYSFVSWAW